MQLKINHNQKHIVYIYIYINYTHCSLDSWALPPPWRKFPKVNAVSVGDGLRFEAFGRSYLSSHVKSHSHLDGICHKCIWLIHVDSGLVTEVRNPVGNWNLMTTRKKLKTHEHTIAHYYLVWGIRNTMPIHPKRRALTALRVAWLRPSWVEGTSSVKRSVQNCGIAWDDNGLNTFKHQVSVYVRWCQCVGPGPGWGHQVGLSHSDPFGRF